MIDSFEENSSPTKVLTWSQHPITKIQKEIDDYNYSSRREWRRKKFSVYRNRRNNIRLCEQYITKLLESGYITNDEYRDIRLIPYRGNQNDYKKAKMEIHKLLFLCTERELYPLILQQIIRYLTYLFDEAGYRRELLLSVVHFAEKGQRGKIYEMAKRDCYLGEIIEKFGLQEIYQKYDKAEAYQYCLITKKITRQL